MGIHGVMIYEVYACIGLDWKEIWQSKSKIDNLPVEVHKDMKF